MIITGAVVLPSPGTAKVRDRQSGQRVQTRICAASSSMTLATGPCLAIPGLFSKMLPRERVSRLGARLRHPGPTLNFERRTLNFTPSSDARLSINQFLLALDVRQNFRVILLQHSLEQHRCFRRVIRLIVIIHDVDLVDFLGGGDSALLDLL